jgi:type I restriction enzyme, S subunit
MTEQRKVVTFAELVERGILEIGDGYRAKLDELGGNGPIFFRAGLLSDRGIDWAIAERFHAELLPKVRSKLSRVGDTIVTTKGNSVGRTGCIPPGAPPFVYSPHLSYWRSLDPSRLSPHFLYYWSRSREFLAQLQAMAGSTDMAPYLSLSDQRRLQLALPEIRVQDAAADVLSALDNKITANDRIASTTLFLADSIFRSLVTGIVPGPETFGSTAKVFGGGTPSTSELSYWGGGIAWTTPSDVTALSSPYLFGTSRTITESGLANCASQLYPAGSIFMTSRATIGAFAIPQLPAAVNQGFIVVVPPRRELRWWLFHEMRSRVEEMMSLANGSTFLELSRTNFKAMAVRLVPVEALREFDAKADSLHRRVAKSVAETSALAELRDVLLPKLISGKIQVQDAEKIVGDAT